MTSVLLFILMLFLAPLALPGATLGPVNVPIEAVDGGAVDTEVGSVHRVVQEAGATPDRGVPRLVADIGRILDGPRWSRAQWGVLAVSLERGDTLYARGAGEALIPASNIKLITTAAALHHLGHDFRFPTFLLADSPVENGVLRGDLVLYGTGDPAISDRFFGSDTEVFRDMARDLVARGIHTVAGDVVGDGTYFGGPVLGSDWSVRDLNDWFAAPVSALSFNENVVTLRVTPASSPGEAAVIHTLPADAGLALVNRARTVAGAPGRAIWATRSMPNEPILVDGEMSLTSPDVWRVMTVHDPPLYASTILRRVLEEEGITVSGDAVGLAAGDASIMRAGQLTAPAIRREAGISILATHESPPLIELLEVVNRASHNLYAELVWMTLGRLVTGDGSFDGGAEAVRRFMEGPVGVEPGSIRLVDGSGLSRLNRLSAGGFVATIAYMHGTDEWEAFLSTLPAAGDRRGLSRMHRTAAQGNLRAKTGTIDRVSALSGTVVTADGERVGFSILANDVPSTSQAKRLEDLIGVRLANFRRSSTADY